MIAAKLTSLIKFSATRLLFHVYFKLIQFLTTWKQRLLLKCCCICAFKFVNLISSDLIQLFTFFQLEMLTLGTVVAIDAPTFISSFEDAEISTDLLHWDGSDLVSGHFWT